MGFAPIDVGRMSLWQFMACVDGWRKAQGAEEEEADPPELIEWYAQQERLHQTMKGPATKSARGGFRA